MLLLRKAEVEKQKGKLEHITSTELPQQLLQSTLLFTKQMCKRSMLLVSWEGTHITLEVLGVVQGVEALARHTVPTHQELHVVPLQVTCSN